MKLTLDRASENLLVEFYVSSVVISLESLREKEKAKEEIRERFISLDESRDVLLLSVRSKRTVWDESMTSTVALPNAVSIDLDTNTAAFFGGFLPPLITLERDYTLDKLVSYFKEGLTVKTVKGLSRRKADYLKDVLSSQYYSYFKTGSGYFLNSDNNLLYITHP